MHVVGMPEQWGRELPGLVGEIDASKPGRGSLENSGSEKMKIAWRYEHLGEFGGSSRGGTAPTLPSVILLDLIHGNR